MIPASFSSYRTEEITSVSSNPFRQVFECRGRDKFGGRCGKIFTSMKSAGKHIYRNPLHDMKLEIRDVNGAYIGERRDRCHTENIVFACKEKHEVALPNSCFIRNCPKCERTRRNRTVSKDLHRIAHMKTPKFLTLTWAGHHGLDVKKDFERALRNFVRRLKRIDDKLQYVRVFEIKKKDDGYYWHCHFVVDMKYIRQETLSSMWKEVTGHSYVVDIRAVSRMNKHSMIAYISKYIAKPIEALSDTDYAIYVYRQRFHDARLHLIEVQYSPIFSCELCDRALEFEKVEPIAVPEKYRPPPPLMSYC